LTREARGGGKNRREACFVFLKWGLLLFIEAWLWPQIPY